MISLGVDPDTQTTAWAVVTDDEPHGPVVLEGGVVKNPSPVRGMKASIAQIRGIKKLPIRSTPDRVVVEGQEFYTSGSKSLRNVQPQKLSLLTLISGAWLLESAYYGATPYCPLPKEWKGQVPKEVHQPRILGRVNLTVPQIAKDFDVTKTQAGHLVDAIGLALWGLEQRK